MEGKNYTITAGYTCSADFEIRVDVDIFSFMVIYGEYENGNGNFICLPKWGIACEAGSARDVHYNTEKLTEVGRKLKYDIDREAIVDCAERIARAISEFSVIAK